MTSPSTPRSLPRGWTYQMYGLEVRSQIRLPLPRSINRTGRADLSIELDDSARTTPNGTPHAEAVCLEPCHAGGAYSRIWRQADGAWIWHDAVGLLHISPDAKRVRVHRRDGCDPGALNMQLLGPVAGFALHQRGFPCLHASAVVTARGAVAFLGWPGDGKSTMVAMHLAQGARLLGDDVLPIELREGEACARSGLPVVKLWPASVRGALAIDRELPRLNAQHDKRLLVLEDGTGTTSGPTPLSALYVLDRYDPVASGSRAVSSTPLAPRAALAVLLTHTYRREYLRPEEVARLLPVYARLASTVPVRALRYPSGFEFQQAVREHIRLDAEVQAA
ncbi:MAG: hypothetical protein JOZ87_05405 [Chloroflexi bacterium]|nr:hypothetical protein [Chloroflexota bacterium]